MSRKALLFLHPAVLRGALRAWLRSKSRSGIMAVMGGAILVIALLAGATMRHPPAPQAILDLDETKVFHEFPAFVAELRAGPARAHAVHLAFTVEVPESRLTGLAAHQGTIETLLKARLGAFDRRDLEGNAGAERIRREILAALNPVIAPAVASAVLFRHLILE